MLTILIECLKVVFVAAMIAGLLFIVTILLAAVLTVVKDIVTEWRERRR